MITKLETNIKETYNFLEKEGIIPTIFPQDEEESNEWIKEILPNFSFKEKEELCEKHMRYSGTNDTEEHTAKFYDYIIQTGFRDLERGLEHNNICQEISFVIQNLTDYTKILDLGCGDGLYSVRIAKEYPNTEIIGIDLSPISIEKAKEKAKKNNLSNTTFTIGNLFDIPEPSENFDAVLTIDVLHEADPPERYPKRYLRPHINFIENNIYFNAFQRISAHLKPNGKAIIGLPTFLEYHEIFKKYLPHIVKQHKLKIKDPETDIKSVEYILEENKRTVKDLFVIAYKKTI